MSVEHSPGPNEVGAELRESDAERIAATDRLIDALEGKSEPDPDYDSENSTYFKRVRKVNGVPQLDVEYDVYYGYTISLYENSRKTSGVHYQANRGLLPRKCPIDERLVSAPRRFVKELRRPTTTPHLNWDKESTPAVEEIDELAKLMARVRPRVRDSGRAAGY